MVHGLEVTTMKEKNSDSGYTCGKMVHHIKESGKMAK
jgi:hypothetical protein